MNDKERAKIQVEDECYETSEEDLGFQMVKHYNYLSSLNHEWSNLCELAVKMYLPNKKYIDELEAKNKQQEKLLIEACKALKFCWWSISDCISEIKESDINVDYSEDERRMFLAKNFLKKDEIKELLERNEKDEKC